MELGEKILKARQEAGLSQRQLCGEVITRNMLSQIEHGTARPSMDTLKYLAARLGKSVSFFLEEDAVVSPNQSVVDSARRLYDEGSYAEGALVLESYRPGDTVYDREQGLLRKLTFLKLAEQAIEEERLPYARELLEKAALETAYCREETERRRLLLLGRLGEEVSERLPSLDEELLLRAREAFTAGNIRRAGQLLDAAEDPISPEWNLLSGQVHMAQGAYKIAAQCLHKAETAYPKETASLLEHCYRELEDYKRAYEYACKQK